MSPENARAALDQAAAGPSRLAGSLRLPSYFHTSIGAAIAVQIATTAWALNGDHRTDAVTAVVVLGLGLAAFIAVAGVQLARFRSLNGAWVSGLASRVVLGTSTLTSVVYAAGLAVAVWAGIAGLPWLLAIVSVVTGAAYAESGRRWWTAYQADPGGRARGGTTVELVALAALAVAGLALLVANR